MIKYLYILILLSSCYKEIEIDIQPHEEKLVVNISIWYKLPFHQSVITDVRAYVIISLLEFYEFTNL